MKALIELPKVVGGEANDFPRLVLEQHGLNYAFINSSFKNIEIHARSLV